MFAGILWLTLIAVITFFWFSVFRFSYNFPYYDDFENIVKFIHDYSQTANIRAKLALLFEQNFEHRVIFSKSVTLLQYFTTGQVNIKWLIILGDLSLIGILCFFIQYHFKKQLSLPALLTVTCLLFQVQHYEDSISWATCALQHAPCIFFSLWSFYLALNRRNLYLSGSLALLALFTSANGLSSIAIWLIIVLVNTADRRKVALPALLLTVVTLVHILTLTIYSGSVLKHATSDIGPKFIFFLSFAGQIADPNMIGSMYPSVFLGALFTLPIVIAGIAILTKKTRSITSVQWFCAAGILTLMFVDFLIVFARGTDADAYGYRMDRYKIYAAFFAALSIGFYDGYLNSLKYSMLPRLGIAASAFVFCLCSYYIYYGSMVSYQKTIEANHYNFLWSKTIYYPAIYWDGATGEYMPDASSTYLKNAVNAQDLNPAGMEWDNLSDSVKVTASENSSYISLSNADWQSQYAPEKLYAIAIESGSRQPRYLFSVESEYQRAVKIFVTTLNKPLSPGFNCRIYKTKLKPGNYDIYLLPIKKGRIIRPYKLRRITV
ncbi:hypothetical protein [Dyadobacter sp. CY323]|uniref:hypothetical protein n=1 Tax=Dyadobacter sp. CY323 TaxID=2907302 RepID=UPI001F1EDBCE|nr:hypothetical protein [Dyadobacter sp. CY323]